MRVLVTGAEGQLGKEVTRSLINKGYEFLACSRNEMDITNQEQTLQKVSIFKPEVIIHCAAFTKVDAAEQEPDEAYMVNAVGSRNVALAAEHSGAKLVYISTDYVFDGVGIVPYNEYDNTNPMSVYGKSKRAGEILVQSLCSRYFIVRTSWLYGMQGNNFVKTILKNAEVKPLLRIVNDQKGSPTYTADLAQFLFELIQTEKYGIYQASNQGECTWYEFAQAIIEEAYKGSKKPPNVVLEPCSTAEYFTLAPRPEYSVMSHMFIKINGFKDLRHWREGLRDFISQWCAADNP